MKSDRVDQIVQAVLYEGYILYPYRPSATKNRQRFTFGRVYPHAFSEARQGSEPCSLQTQCLVQGRAGHAPPALTVKARFLQPLARDIGRLPKPLPVWTAAHAPEYSGVAELRVEERLYQTWQEAVEQTIPAGPFQLTALVEQPHAQPFSLPAAYRWEPIQDGAGRMVGVVVRRQAALTGQVDVSAERLEAGLYRVTIRLVNLTPLTEPDRGTEDEAVLLRTLASTHIILTVEAGAFISLMDPPPSYAQAAATCQHQGVWPVLVGDAAQGECHTLLASPIILYDYPEIAPESMGNMFDSTEIDELLMLRVLTLTDEEKQMMRQVDEYARQILQRSEALSAEQLLRLHGTVREMRPAE